MQHMQIWLRPMNGRRLVFGALSLAALAAAAAGGAARGLRFTEEQVADGFGYCFSVLASDLDGDGDLDLTSADALRNYVYWFENDGHGRFTRRVIHNDEAGWFERNAIGDIDGDGKTDVAIVKNLTGELLWFRNRGTNRWDRFVIHTDFKRAYDVVLVDLDGDGWLDVAASAWVGNYLAWFRNPGPNGWGQDWPKQVIDRDIAETRTIRVGDFNGDGRPDLLATARAGSLVVWYENPGRQSASPWPRHVIDDRSPSPTHGHPVDLDGDGDLDVVMALGMLAVEGAQLTHQAVWYENADGTGTSWRRHVIGSLPYGFEAYVSDLDGDGDLDVAASSCGEIPYVAGQSVLGQVVWFENGGDARRPGPWTKHVLKDRWPSGTQLIVADLNGDGRPDIAAAGEKGSQEIRWWRNDGVGDLPARPPPPPGTVVSNTAPFSVGYGWTGAWTVRETAAVNTPANAPDPDGRSFVCGDFRFTITAAARLFGSAGPTFPGRRLADGPGGADGVADSSSVTVRLQAEYVGPALTNAAPGSVGIVLELDRVGVMAVKHSAVGATNVLNWVETTPDFADVSPAVALASSSDLTEVGAYRAVAWSPAPVRAEDAIRVVRTFGMSLEPAFAVDGLELSGRVTLFYSKP